MNRRILVDTNVLIYDFMYRVGNELTHISHSELNTSSNTALRKFANASYQLCIASYSIPQLVSNLQASGKKRRAFTLKEIVQELSYILAKYEIGTFAKSHIEETRDVVNDIIRNYEQLMALEKASPRFSMAQIPEPQFDIEDRFMIRVALKLKCHYIMTYNKKDFIDEINIRSFLPSKLHTIREFKNI